MIKTRALLSGLLIAFLRTEATCLQCQPSLEGVQGPAYGAGGHAPKPVGASGLTAPALSGNTLGNCRFPLLALIHEICVVGRVWW